MPDKNVFDRYLLSLRKTPIDEKTEHTDRLALETLLQALADDTQKGIKVQHEPKRVVDKGDNTVEAVRYSPQEQAIAINKTQSFKPVPEDVWNFHIGGYQVLDKYLKSRKGRKLVLDEINHVAAVADALAFTIAQMARIDDAYKAAFPDRG